MPNRPTLSRVRVSYQLLWLRHGNPNHPNQYLKANGKPTKPRRKPQPRKPYEARDSEA